ncbi:MAG: corrinoid protein [Bacteroidetes bacterium]|nr:corrinoid protein [Bacteroidota bacterium]MCL5737357.1 corrinoid protein [Bacteroidota bacterium]
MGITDELGSLARAVIDGKHLDAESLTFRLLEEGIEARTILDDGLLPGMDVVGRCFRDNLIFLPQVLVSARAMKVSMKILEPLLANAKIKSKGKILFGTVKGDFHDIGKNIVEIMLQGTGYTVIDIGTDCDKNKFLLGFEQHKPDVIGISAMLTTTMVYMKVVIDYLREKKVSVPIIVGGAPLNKKFSEEIGATGYGKNAADAVELVKNILKGQVQR